MRILLILAFAILMNPAAAFADQSVWQALKQPNHFAIMRHALAPGGGDPEGFQLGDCATQRNLSYEGRDQARSAGDSFRANGITSARVFTSQWCRCKETAELMALGVVKELPELNSFFQNPEREAPQMRALRQIIADMDLSTPTLLVTHQVLITSLTEVFPTSGEMVVVERLQDGSLQVVGSVKL
jgi:phosphohistidine phosphatase SixA